MKQLLKMIKYTRQKEISKYYRQLNNNVLENNTLELLVNYLNDFTNETL